MAGWSDGYTVDIDYTRVFFREQAPAFLSYCLLLRGIAPPDLSSFTCCELGCGHGLTANLLAAANPGGRFWAFDFNPDHVTGAERLAKAAGLDNIHFSDASFAELDGLETPDFDFITMHGVYSWVSRENQQHILRFIRKRLKPGGVVFVSYNAMPGWTALLPLRQIIFDHAARSSGGSVERLAAGLAFANQLAGAGAVYFRDLPIARRELERLAALPAKYTAHEYLIDNWRPRFFAEVAADMADAKLGFAASADPADHIDGVNFAPEALAFLGGITDPLARESARDILVDQHFRRDIFIRGAARLTPQEHEAQLAATPLCLTVPRDAAPAGAAFRVGEVAFDAALYAALLDELADGPATLEAFRPGGRLGGFGWANVIRLVTLLLAKGILHPCPPAGALPSSTGERFNAAVAERVMLGDDLPCLAAPAIGGAVEMDALSHLFLRALRRGEEPVRSAWRALAGWGQCLSRNGRPLQSEAENLALLQERFDVFSARRLPLLKRLAVV